MRRCLACLACILLVHAADLADPAWLDALRPALTPAGQADLLRVPHAARGEG